MIKVAIAGSGRMSSIHAECYAQISEVEIVGFVGKGKERRQVLARRHHTRDYCSLAELLSSEDVDIVDVCLPTFLHKENVILAAETGVDILLEKPFALTLTEADAMIEAVKKNKVKLMVAHILRFWPEYMFAKKITETKELGKPICLAAHRLAYRPEWLPWFADPNQSGGAVIDLQIHDMDFIFWIFGMPRRTFSAGRKSEGGAWDQVLTTLEYSDKIASVEASYLMPSNYTFEHGYRIIFENGVIEYRSHRRGGVEKRGTAETTLAVYRQGSKKPEYLSLPKEDAFLSEIKYFVSCISNNCMPEIISVEEARSALLLVISAKKSIESGSIVDLTF